MTLRRDRNTHAARAQSGVTVASLPCASGKQLLHFDVCLASELVFFQNKTTTNQKELGRSVNGKCHIAKAGGVLSRDLLIAQSPDGTCHFS